MELPRHDKVTDPDKIVTRVKEAYEAVGHLLNNVDQPALIVDALCMDCPIVGATPDFCKLVGYDLDQILGNNCRMMLQGVPDMAISRSARKNIRNYCNMCQVVGLKEISEVASLQPNARKDGRHFMNYFLLGLCRVQNRFLILGVPMHLGDGLFVKLTSQLNTQTFESARDTFKRIRDYLRLSVDGLRPCETLSRQVTAASQQPDFGFFAERLQDHCLLINSGFTAIRREADEVPTNAITFSDRPVKLSKEGLSFTVHVDEITRAFHGLPVLGFTKRKPTDHPDLYPTVAKGMGSSVLVGACGEAFARDQYEHHVFGFKKPTKEQLSTWGPKEGCLLPVLERGDLLGCTYTREGRAQMHINDELIIDFDVERPIDVNAAYYAVIDVYLSAQSLTIMRSQEVLELQTTDEEVVETEDQRFAREVSFSTAQDSFATIPARSEGDHSGSSEDGRSLTPPDSNTNVDVETLSAAVNEVLVKQGIKTAIGECTFMVTIADPSAPDCPLIAVSDEFEAMTGFLRHEIIGVNCRFLNQGCDMDPEDLLKLRQASQTGEPFTAILPNRKKSGELFLNLLDLRGLTVAKNPETGEDLWFLVGIQADVTDIADEDVVAGHKEQLQVVSDGIRRAIRGQLAAMAVHGAATTPTSRGTTGRAAWRLLNAPKWRKEARGAEPPLRPLSNVRAAVSVASASHETAVNEASSAPQPQGLQSLPPQGERACVDTQWRPYGGMKAIVLVGVGAIAVAALSRFIVARRR